MDCAAAKLAKQRPVSPHLTIYKAEITSTLSILHRLTGVALFLGTLIFTWWIILGVFAGSDVGEMSWSLLPDMVLQILLLGWAFSLFFHFFNGIRHLFWDAGFGFCMNTVKVSGITVLVLSLLFTALSWFFVIS